MQPRPTVWWERQGGRSQEARMSLELRLCFRISQHWQQETQGKEIFRRNREAWNAASYTVWNCLYESQDQSVIHEIITNPCSLGPLLPTTSCKRIREVSSSLISPHACKLLLQSECHGWGCFLLSEFWCKKKKGEAGKRGRTKRGGGRERSIIFIIFIIFIMIFIIGIFPNIYQRQNAHIKKLKRTLLLQDVRQKTNTEREAAILSAVLHIQRMPKQEENSAF